MQLEAYERGHAPTLDTTLAMIVISLAAVIQSIVLDNTPALYVLLIFVTVTFSAPVSLIRLVRASVFRDGLDAFNFKLADHAEHEGDK